jgi:Flp pilus assembly pilin Flp
VLATRQRFGEAEAMLVKRLLVEESAQGMTEYAMIVGAIVFTAVVTFLMMGDRLKQILGLMQGQLNDVPTS